MAKKTGTVKKKVVKVGAVGMAYVHSTFNNVIITITNESGDVISWSSAGKMGFRGSKKNTPYAAQTSAADCAKVAYDMGLRKVKVYVKGPGAGRESAVRTIHGAGIEVMEIIRCRTTAAALPTAVAYNFSSDDYLFERFRYAGRRDELVRVLPGREDVSKKAKVFLTS